MVPGKENYVKGRGSCGIGSSADALCSFESEDLSYGLHFPIFHAESQVPTHVTGSVHLKAGTALRSVHS